MRRMGGIGTWKEEGSHRCQMDLLPVSLCLKEVRLLKQDPAPSQVVAREGANLSRVHPFSERVRPCGHLLKEKCTHLASNLGI